MSDELDQATGGDTAGPGGEETLLTAEAPTNGGGEGQTGKEGDSGTPASAAKGEAPSETGEKDSKPAEPEPYELTAPDGYPMGADALKAFTDHCRAAGFSKEQAEKQLDWMKGNYQRWQEEQVTQRKSWREELRADKDFGGDKYDASLAEARQALAQFDDGGQIRAMLNETGYGDHPAVVRIFARVGRALAEDNAIGKSDGGGKKSPLEDRLYPGWKV